MTMLSSFHEVRFPTDLSLGATGGPERRTEIVTLGSGQEQRNTRWVHSRRRFNAGYGIKSLSDLQTVIEFFEERRGRLFGFRFRDQLDWKSCRAGEQITGTDQVLGVGDGSRREFQLVKQYGDTQYGYQKHIVKPVAGTISLTQDGSFLPSSKYEIDNMTGIVTFDENEVPPQGSIIAAGYEFDIPVRFETDEISINLSHFEAGDIPTIPLMELLP